MDARQLRSALTPPTPQFLSLSFISFFSEEEALGDSLLRFSAVKHGQQSRCLSALDLVPLTSPKPPSFIRNIWGLSPRIFLADLARACMRQLPLKNEVYPP